MKKAEENTGLQVGQKVSFNYWDFDKNKEIFGRGKIVEIDLENGVIHIQTTRTLHWMEYDHQMKNIRII